MTQDTISLTLENREVLGKAVKHLRKAGTLPAVIHDHGKDSVHAQADFVQMVKVYKLAGKHHPVQLTIGTKKYTAIIKDADIDPKKNMLRHVVFNAVNANEQVEAEVPIHPRYDEGNDSSPAERAGFMVLSQLDTVSISAVPSMLPDAIYYNAEKLVEVGDHAIVDDLFIPEGVTVKMEGTHTIATVFEPSALAAANEAAGGDAEEEAPAATDEDATASDDDAAADEEDKPAETTAQ